METITVPKYVIDEAIDAVRLAYRILESAKRETAADRQIEFTHRLLAWVKDGQIGEPPRWIPGHKYEK